MDNIFRLGFEKYAARFTDIGKGEKGGLDENIVYPRRKKTPIKIKPGTNTSASWGELVASYKKRLPEALKKAKGLAKRLPK